MESNKSESSTIEEFKPLKINYRNVEIVCDEEEYKKIVILANDLFHKLNIDKVEIIKFPIDQIDGLSCNPVLYINYFHNLHTNDYSYSITFRIISNKLMNDISELKKVYFIEKLIEENNKLITVIDIIEMLIVIKYLFFNLKYCYVRNMLALNSSLNLDLLISIFDNPNVRILGEKCCVCFMTTTNKTKCNHYLCYKCWEQVKPKIIDDEEDDEEDETILPCPICRQDIYYIK